MGLEVGGVGASGAYGRMNPPAELDATIASINVEQTSKSEGQPGLTRIQNQLTFMRNKFILSPEQRNNIDAKLSQIRNLTGKNSAAVSVWEAAHGDQAAQVVSDAEAAVSGKAREVAANIGDKIAMWGVETPAESVVQEPAPAPEQAGQPEQAQPEQPGSIVPKFLRDGWDSGVYLLRALMGPHDGSMYGSEMQQHQTGVYKDKLKTE